MLAAYRLVREEIGELQLALVGSMALDDPEGWEVYGQVAEQAADDPLIHLYTNLTGVGNVEVNAFQRLSERGRAEVHPRGLRAGRLGGAVEGHARRRRTRRRHPAADAGWRRRRDGRLRRGVRDGDAQAAGQTAAWPSSSGRSGREHVREHFLLPRLLMEELRLLATLA